MDNRAAKVLAVESDDAFREQIVLQVFCIHLIFCFVGLALLGNASILSGWKQSGLLAITLLAMLLTAKLFAKTEATADGNTLAN